MKKLFFIVFVINTTFLIAQRNYGTPIDGQIPDKLNSFRRAIEVNNFPKSIDAIKIDNTYYWKHTTSILCRESEIKIVEYGAYLYYNNQWNLRKSYPLKEFNKNFGSEKEIINQAQPYTWKNNWRTDTKLYSGWAMWYFIGITSSGERVCGYEKIETTDHLLNPL